MLNKNGLKRSAFRIDSSLNLVHSTLFTNHSLTPLFPQLSEDELLALSHRFLKEGLDYNISSDKKLLHVWRWLLDAESNCLSLRKQIDKLHRQQELDMKEVEDYVETIWKKSNERLLELEKENKELRNELNFRKYKTESWDAEKNNLCDSIKIKTGLSQNSPENEKEVSAGDCSTNRSHVCKECENELNEYKQYKHEVLLLLKTKRNLEIENETLAFKLNESMALCDHFEKKLQTSAHLEFSQKSKILNTGSKKTGHSQGAKIAFPNQSMFFQTSNDNSLVNQIEELKRTIETLESELNAKNCENHDLKTKYDKRKTRHRERLLRLKDHIEMEARRWELLFQTANHKRILAENELKKHKELSVQLTSN